MNKEFVPYDIALAMKELGFDERCLGYYYNYKGDWRLEYEDASDYGEYDEIVNAPLYQQAFRWFREKYNLTFNYLPLAENGHSYKVYEENKPICNQIITDSYEEAQDACLRKLIQIVKQLRRN